jgi:predicted DNA-binding ribbon-helix-helix protein
MLPPQATDLQAGSDISGVCQSCIMKSHVAKRSVIVAGHKTSVSLEEAFWDGMKEISRIRKMTLSDLANEVNSNRHEGNLSSAIRLFVLSHFKSRAAPGPISIRTSEAAAELGRSANPA